MKTQKFLHLDYVPDGLLDISHQDLHGILASPTLIELSGKHPEPLFVSVLLHGNEPTGFKAVQSVLKKYLDKGLPRSITVFIGNVAAAKHNLRRLDGQPDYNRIWPGTELALCAETALAAEIFSLMKSRKVFASIDIHNNTGLNPHYACVNSLDYPFLNLAALFGRLVVYFIRPKGVQSAAFAELCPAVTLECGRPDQKHGVGHAFEFLESCLHLAEFPQRQIHSRDIDIFHTVAQVKIAENIKFSFKNPDTGLLLNKDIERMNFSEIPAGTVWGKTDGSKEFPLLAYDEFGKEVTSDFFRIHDRQLQITRTTMPSMLTLDEQVILQDCLCYLMERLPVSGVLENIG